MMKRINALLCAAGALLTLTAGAQAQDWPQRAIKIIVPFSTGGPTDPLARLYARKISESLGQPVIVENRPGASGSLGLSMVAKAAPDGYTLGLAHTGTIGINPHVVTAHPFDPLSDITPITPVVGYSNVLVVGTQVPARNVSEFLAWSKANPKLATYASGASGGTNHLSGEILKTISGVALLHVPYKGNGPAMIDVMAGNVSAMFEVPAEALAKLETGKIRALAITGTSRSPILPDVPTMKEAGFPGFEQVGSDLWIGFVAPANLPAPILARLHAEMEKASTSPEIQEFVRRLGYRPWTMKPAEFKKFIQDDYGKWGQLVKSSGAKMD